MIRLLLLLLLGLPSGYVSYLVFTSKLSSFNKPSLIFRILYAVYNSYFGQFLHSFLLRSHAKKANGVAHTNLCAEPFDFETFFVVYLPYLMDNYAYFLIDKTSGETAVVDPGDPYTVLEEFSRLKTKFLQEHSLKIALKFVLTTHKHQDHSGGNNYLSENVQDIEVIAGTEEAVPGVTRVLKHQEKVNIGHTVITLYNTPCHTVGHVSYFVGDMSYGESKKALFTGDTLFIGGVGKFFEGDAKIMHDTLQLIASFPLDTYIFCGHEYTVSNLRFGLTVEPHNQTIQKRLKWAEQMREEHQTTIPSQLRDEFLYNVFLRTSEESVMQSCGENVKSPIKVLARLRKWKDDK